MGEHLLHDAVVHVLKIDQLCGRDQQFLDVVVDEDLVALDVVHDGDVGHQRALAVAVELEGDAVWRRERDVGEARAVQETKHGELPCVVLHLFHVEVGQARVAEEFIVLPGHHVGEVLETLAVVNVRDGGHGRALGAGGLAVGDRAAAVEDQHVGHAALPVVDQREGQREAHQEEGGHGDAVVRAPLLRSLGDRIRDGELEGVGVAADEEVGQSEFALVLVLEPAVGTVAVRAAVDGVLRMTVEVVVAVEVPVALQGRRIVAVFVVLADDFLEAAGCRGKFLPVPQGGIHGQQVRDQDADAVGVGHVVADLADHHLLAVRIHGVHHAEHVTLGHVGGLAAEAAEEGLVGVVRVEAQGRNLADFALFLEILHCLLALLDETEPEAVVALKEFVERLRHQRFVESFVEGDGKQDVQDAFEEGVFVLETDDILRTGEVIKRLTVYFHCCLSLRRFLYSSRSALPGSLKDL